MELSAHQRRLYGRLAWFEVRFLVPGMRLRPLSLMSWEAMDLMGVKLFSLPSAGVDIDLERERQEIAAYTWLHSAPIEEVGECVWNGEWEAVASAVAPLVTDGVISKFGEFRARTVLALAASRFGVRERKINFEDDEGEAKALERQRRLERMRPPGVIGPLPMAFDVGLLARSTGWNDTKILWHLWLPKAWQMMHQALAWEGDVWTVFESDEIGNNSDEAESDDDTGEVDLAPECMTPSEKRTARVTELPDDDEEPPLTTSDQQDG